MEVPDQFKWVIQWMLKIWKEKKHASIAIDFKDGGILKPLNINVREIESPQKENT